MSAASHLRFAYLSYFSRPKHERPLYRLIRRQRVRKMLEIGMGQGGRAARMIDVALRYHPADRIHFTGIDLFEAREATAGPGISLKQAYRLLRNRGVRTQIMPGDPFAALSHIANGLQGYELVVVSADQDPESLARAWFYLPRVLSADCHVLVERRGAEHTTFERIPRAELEKFAATRQRRAA